MRQRPVRLEAVDNLDCSRVELYDIPCDPMELTNLADRHPEVLKRLSQQLLGWQKNAAAGAAHDLVAVPSSLQGKVAIENEDFSRVGSSSMTPEMQFRLVLRVRELFKSRRDLAGIVITHGTDSLEQAACSRRSPL